MRQRIGIADRGKVLFRADLSYGDDEAVIVEADGLGGGLLLVVEGNYPVDFLTRGQFAYPTEIEASDAAVNLLREARM
jgi:hypothetical protein